MLKFRQFMCRNQLEYNYINARLYAYSAAEILIEGAKRSGKRITRKKLVGAIEGLYSFDAGLNKPVSWVLTWLNSIQKIKSSRPQVHG